MLQLHATRNPLHIRVLISPYFKYMYLHGDHPVPDMMGCAETQNWDQWSGHWMKERRRGHCFWKHGCSHASMMSNLWLTEAAQRNTMTRSKQPPPGNPIAFAHCILVHALQERVKIWTLVQSISEARNWGCHVSSSTLAHQQHKATYAYAVYIAWHTSLHQTLSVHTFQWQIQSRQDWGESKRNLIHHLFNSHKVSWLCAEVLWRLVMAEMINKTGMFVLIQVSRCFMMNMKYSLAIQQAEQQPRIFVRGWRSHCSKGWAG